MSTVGLAMTLASEPWMAAHYWQVLDAIPQQWTDLDPRSMLMLGHKLELIGVKWDGDDELVRICVYLERIGMLERRGGQGATDKIRQHPLAFNRSPRVAQHQAV